ncbi:hypothetical protein ACKFKF_03645 [Phormidesmis sp. 146-12]
MRGKQLWEKGRSFKAGQRSFGAGQRSLEERRQSFETGGDRLEWRGDRSERAEFSRCVIHPPVIANHGLSEQSPLKQTGRIEGFWRGVLALVEGRSP